MKKEKQILNGRPVNEEIILKGYTGINDFGILQTTINGERYGFNYIEECGEGHDRYVSATSRDDSDCIYIEDFFDNKIRVQKNNQIDKELVDRVNKDYKKWEDQAREE